MTDLAEFLLARIADTIANARAVQSQGATDGVDVDDPRRPELSLARWAIKDAEAKRRIVEAFQRVSRMEQTAADDLRHISADRASAWHTALRFLALPHADHPDYREEWRS